MPRNTETSPIVLADAKLVEWRGDRSAPGVEGTFTRSPRIGPERILFRIKRVVFITKAPRHPHLVTVEADNNRFYLFETNPSQAEALSVIFSTTITEELPQ